MRAGPDQRHRLRGGPQPGKHDWPFADQAFVRALPWLAGQLDTPQAPRISLPGAGGAAAQVVTAGR
ncbi:conserved membrane domain protein [Mycobacterium kansasii]|uniref:Conserved membrane domain protein n=1 Tax=Mycobacterium kansasii TaxID=1768 RepID=A0A1V3WI40_MYCKA|nr:conserved membrane domain protein [Mycobacterium kansasii]